MTLEELRKVVHATPFQPFKLHLADGRSVSVPHPDFIAIGGQGRTAIITTNDENLWHVIDLLLVTDVEVGGAAPATH